MLRYLQAESELSDPAKREELDATIAQARIQLLKSLSLPPNTPEDDPKLKDLKPPYKEQFRAKSKDMLIEEELRRRKYASSPLSLLLPTVFVVRTLMIMSMLGRAIKMNLANEGLEARKKEEEVATRKRKAEDDKKWEGESSDSQIPRPRSRQLY